VLTAKVAEKRFNSLLAAAWKHVSKLGSQRVPPGSPEPTRKTDKKQGAVKSKPAAAAPVAPKLTTSWATSLAASSKPAGGSEAVVAAPPGLSFKPLVGMKTDSLQSAKPAASVAPVLLAAAAVPAPVLPAVAAVPAVTKTLSVFEVKPKARVPAVPASAAAAAAAAVPAPQPAPTAVVDLSGADHDDEAEESAAPVAPVAAVASVAAAAAMPVAAKLSGTLSAIFAEDTPASPAPARAISESAPENFSESAPPAAAAAAAAAAPAPGSVGAKRPAPSTGKDTAKKVKAEGEAKPLGNILNFFARKA